MINVFRGKKREGWQYEQGARDYKNDKFEKEKF